MYGIDDTEEHIQLTLEKGNIPLSVSSFEVIQAVQESITKGTE